MLIVSLYLKTIQVYYCYHYNEVHGYQKYITVRLYFTGSGNKKVSPRRGIEPRSDTRQASILTIKLSRKRGKEMSTHAGGRTQNLLIRSQTRCHYATRAQVLVVELVNSIIYYNI